jgi:uncharacterized protein YfiM (DUF2279 family)
MRRQICAIAAASLLALTLTGCKSSGPVVTPMPEWVTTASTGRFNERTYLVGKGSARSTGDPIADARAARDQARADLLSRVVVRVQSDFLTRISEYRVGNQWTETGETVSKIRTTVAATLPVQPEEEIWTDHRAGQTYMLMGISRAAYAGRLREDLQQMVEAHGAEIGRAERLAASGQSLEALRALNRVETAIPEYQIANLSFGAVAPGTTGPATPATPSKISEIRSKALEGCVMRVEANADGHDASARDAVGAVLLSAGMAVAQSGARYLVRLEVEGETKELVLREGVPGVAHGRYGWRLTVLPVHGGNDFSFVEESSASPDRAVAHSGPLSEMARIRREAVEQAVAKATRVLAQRLGGIE